MDPFPTLEEAGIQIPARKPTFLSPFTEEAKQRKEAQVDPTLMDYTGIAEEVFGEDGPKAQAPVYQQSDAGRPSAVGSHLESEASTRIYSQPASPVPSREEMIAQLWDNPDYTIKGGTNFKGMTDDSVAGAYRWAQEIRKQGYRPWITSGFRSTGTMGAHSAGGALDVGITNLDGSTLGDDELEYRLTKEAASKAGWSSALNELAPGSSKYWSGPHIHLSMFDTEGEKLGHNHDTHAVRDNLRYKRRRKPPTGKRATARAVASSSGIDPDWFEALVDAESGFRSRNKDGSHLRSEVGATGLVQMMPDTVKYVAEKYNLDENSFYESDAAQLRFGALYFKEQLDTFGDYASATAAYNAGPGGVENMKRSGSAYSETKEYYRKIKSNAFGLDVSSDEAERDIVFGQGTKHKPRKSLERFRQDEQETTNWFRDMLGFGGRWAGNIAEHGMADAGQGMQEFVHGLTLGLSSFVPGLAPGDQWDNLRAPRKDGWMDYLGSDASITDKTASLFLEGPWFLGSVLAGEMLAAGYAAKGAQGLAAPAAQQFGNLGRRVFEKSYNKMLARNGGKLGTMGRMLYGRPVSFMDNMAAHVGSFGTQSMVEGSSVRIKNGAGIDEIVTGGIKDFMMGAAFGWVASMGIPLATGMVGHGIAGTAKVGRAMTPGLNMPGGLTSALEVGKGLVGKAGPGFDDALKVTGRTAMRTGAGGFVGAIGGGANATLQGTDVFEGTKQGAMAGAAAAGLGVEAMRSFLKQVPAAAQQRITNSIDNMYGKLDDYQKAIFTSAVMEKAGIFESERRAAQDAATSKYLKQNLETNISSRQENLDALKQQMEFGLAEETRITKELDQVQQASEFLERQSPEIGTYGQSYLDLKEEQRFLAREKQALREQIREQGPNEYAQDQLKDIDNSGQKVFREIESLLKDKPQLQQWAGFQERINKFKAELDHVQNLDSTRMAKQVYPEMIRGVERIIDDNKRMLEHLNQRGIDDPLPEAVTPWEFVAEGATSKEKELAERLLTTHVRNFAENVKNLPPDPHILQALDRIKTQTFVDPRGQFADDLDSLIKYHESKLEKLVTPEGELRGSSKVVYKPRGAKRRKEFLDKSPIRWGVKKGESPTFADAATLHRYVNQGLPFGSDWNLPESVLDKMHRGEEIPMPYLTLGEDGRVVVRNPENLQAAVALGQTQVPVKFADDSSAKAIKSELNRFKKRTRQEEISQLNQVKNGLLKARDDIFGARNVEGVITRVEGGNILKANPYRVDYDTMMQEIEQEFGINAAFARENQLQRELTAPETESVMGKAYEDFKKLSSDDINSLMETRLTEYVYMFDAEDTPAKLRSLALEKAQGSMDVLTNSGKYMDSVGAPLIESAEKLWWRVNGKMKAKADGVIDQNDITGHTMRSYIELHGDQMAMQEYTNKLGEQFEIDVSQAADQLISTAKPGTTNGARITKAISDILGDPMEPGDLTPDNIRAALTWALDSNETMGTLLRDAPELAPAVKTFLKHQEQWEGVIRRSPHLKSYMRPAYVMHKYKGMTEFMQRHPDSEHVSRVATRLTTERQRSFPTLRAAKDFAAEQRARLGNNTTPEQFLNMSLNNKIQTVKRKDPQLMTPTELKAAQDDIEALTTGLLVGNPVTDPVQLMTSKVRMTVQADTMRRFLTGLTNFEVPVNASGAKERLLVIGSGRNMKSDKIGAYTKLSDISGWDAVRIEDLNGKSVGATDLYVHPEVGNYLKTYAQATQSMAQENWNTFMGLLRTSTLFGTPAPHFLNTLSNNLAEFILTPARAVGMIGSGKKIMEDGIDGTSGEFLKLYAMKAGVNTKVMRTTTRMIAKDIQKHMDQFAPDIFGEVRAPQGIGRSLAAIDPMEEARRTAARSTMGEGGKILSEVAGMLPEADYIVNRKMLFDIIEQSQLGGFFYRTASYLEELRARDEGFAKLPLDEQLKHAQEAAKERVNEVAGALPYLYHTDKTRKWVYNTILTPSWFLTKARSFVSALDAQLGLMMGNDSKLLKGMASSPVLQKTVGRTERGAAALKNIQEGATITSSVRGRPRTRFGHLPKEVRELYAKKLVNSVATGLAAYVGGVQTVSYLVNGHSTFENPDPKKWLHLRVGSHYYNNPMFGFFRDVAKALTGTAMGEGIEPWIAATKNQMMPTAKAVMSVANNRDGFTGRPVYRPNASAGEQALQSMGYILSETVSFDELFGGRNLTIPEIYKTLGVKGQPLNRLDGREWLLRMFGVWESDYNAPARIAGSANASLSWFKQDLRTQVLDRLEAAHTANDPGKKNDYIRDAYSLAVVEGIPIKDDRLRPYFPNGNIRMSREGFKNLITKISNPQGYYLKGAGKPKKEVFQHLLKELQKEQALQEREGYKYLINRRRSAPPVYQPQIPINQRSFG